MERKQINTQSGFDEEIRAPKETQQSYEMAHTVTPKSPNSFRHQENVIFLHVIHFLLWCATRLGCVSAKSAKAKQSGEQVEECAFHTSRAFHKTGQMSSKNEYTNSCANQMDTPKASSAESQRTRSMSMFPHALRTGCSLTAPEADVPKKKNRNLLYCTRR